MKGFEVTINDNAPILAACDNLVSLIISVGYADGGNIYIGGLDSNDFHLKWPGKRPELGDKIKVRVIETNVASPVCERHASDRMEMKKKYYELKKQLEEEGVL